MQQIGKFKKTAEKIPNEWELLLIKDISKVRRGASPRPIEDPRYFGHGRGWVRIADVTKSKKYLERTRDYLSELGESRSVAVNPGDLIMSIAATVGRPIIVKMNACIHDGFVLFSNLSNEIDVEFLYYLLISLQDKFRNIGQHGTQKNLNTVIVSNIEFLKPPLKEQQKIALILSKVDESIQIVSQKIAQTKILRRALMKRLLTKGIGHTKFKKTEMAEIPDAWTIVNLGEHVELRSGKSNPTKNLSGSNPIPVYGANGITGFFTDYLIGTPTIVIGRVGEYAGSIHVTNGKSWITDNAIYFSKLPEFLDVKFLGYFLIQYDLGRLAEKTGQPKLTQVPIKQIKIPLPTLQEQQKIVSILSNVEELIETQITQGNELQNLKMGLMQQLLTGKLRVRVG